MLPLRGIIFQIWHGILKDSEAVVTSKGHCLTSEAGVVSLLRGGLAQRSFSGLHFASLPCDTRQKRQNIVHLFETFSKTTKETKDSEHSWRHFRVVWLLRVSVINVHHTWPTWIWNHQAAVTTSHGKQCILLFPISMFRWVIREFVSNRGFV